MLYMKAITQMLFELYVYFNSNFSMTKEHLGYLYSIIRTLNVFIMELHEFDLKGMSYKPQRVEHPGSRD